jgi:hypothetical protein
MTKITIKKFFNLMFPTIHAYFNFMMLLVFLGVLIYSHDEDKIVVLISAFAVCYFLNEWRKVGNDNRKNHNPN